MKGILLFGWSTAVLFEILRRTIEHLATIAPPGTAFSADQRFRGSGSKGEAQ